MMNKQFNTITSTCIPIAIDNCNTDLIIPARYLASTTRDPSSSAMHSCTTCATMPAATRFMISS